MQCFIVIIINVKFNHFKMLMFYYVQTINFIDLLAKKKEIYNKLVYSIA